MSRIAVVSQEFDAVKAEWVTVEVLSQHSIDDEDEAKREAKEHAADTLNALIEAYELPAEQRTAPLPWTDRIIVCPMLDDDTPETLAKTFSIQIEIE